MVMLTDRHGGGRLDDGSICRSVRRRRKRMPVRIFKTHISRQRTGLKRLFRPARVATKVRGPVGVARAFYSAARPKGFGQQCR